MKPWLALFILLTLIIPRSIAENINSLWSKVEQAEQKKLPKSAIKILDQILELTRQSQTRGHYLKALSKKILNQAHILGKQPRDKVKILREKISSSPKADRPILQAILAIWFWHYHEQNRYKFSQRSTTSGLENEDFTTWDSPKLFHEVGSLFEQALKDRRHLRSLILKDFEPLVERGSLGYGYCKTLYEFLAREALRFYKHGLQTLPKPQDAFEIEADSHALSESENFLSYKPDTTDTDSLLLKALEIYQELLTYLKKTQNEDAYLDTEISRLIFFHENALGTVKKERFRRRLQELVGQHPHSKLSALATHQLAKLAEIDQDLVLAVELCSGPISKFPGSSGATLCRNLTNRITAKEYNVKIEHTLNVSNSSALVEYKNLTTLHIRIVKDSWRRVLEEDWANPGDHLNDQQMQSILGKEPVAQWSVSLSETSDYKQTSEEIDLPPLKYGYYRLLISHRSDFGRSSGNKVVQGAFWSTDTTLLLRRLNTKIQGLVVDARDGKPLQGRTIEIFKRGKRGRYGYFQSVQSKEDGTFFFHKPEKNRYGTYLFYARSTTGDVLFHEPMGHGNRRNKQVSRGVLFYTDRSLYRPGQTIQFKGICYEKDPAAQNYEVNECRNVKVVLRDANYQEVERLTKNGNEFGSFSGQFTAPRGRLTGAYTIVASSPAGTTRIRIEEYKRPKFEVELKALEKEVRLQAEVLVEGIAKSYAGVPVADAVVKYRVLRTVRMPWWWRWHNPFGNSREIANGKEKTNDQGEFSIPFQAIPDRSVDREIDPSFNYEVQVDVIDPTGET
ncbi:hypothetical protein HOF92_14935, partial [bacterium]|nr:hypothetical protein [bacterium]